MISTQQKLLSIAAHLGWIIGFPVLLPVLIFLLSKDDFVRQQAKEALCFQMAIVGAGIVLGILSFLLIGIPLLIIMGILASILPFVAAFKVLNGQKYSYPITGKYIAKKL
ncbi:hypothetical protein SAMN02745883_00972 [Caminicella sporogenes DSM 14501]|uniref:DUF4870 domain-containing protein n=1 Tax=Caminicella sporogenes DSM 14501 TaxID=1121266 RepID=A0A1M6NPK4_9FIRM|nr:DUF4870 domain-containing protein [Caminicella sporogenes]RKD22129.1 hypothetical protein BET04_05745 [Caminicella sporogenes]WIF95745.1 DUF4870 domain-containing protein [Caminicella sporogenes]SHJ97681.1 hypothetical protein SAMN02745883_00972 [Caminicella sporogenes DSM 14501]